MFISPGPLLLPLWILLLLVIESYSKYAVVTLGVSERNSSTSDAGEAKCLIPLFFHLYKNVAQGSYDFVVLTFRIDYKTEDRWRNSGMIVHKIDENSTTYNILKASHYFKAILLKVEALRLVQYEKVILSKSPH